MRRGNLIGVGAIVAAALSLGFVLSLATTRVKNWFVMTDELYYERLAIAVAQTGSLLPRIHGEVVWNVNQLYPVLLSTVYGNGNVPASFEDAHRLNAFVIATTAVPVYLLARRVGVGTALAVAAGALAVAVPWIVLASFLLTEVVAYPAACWAVLAIVHAVERRSWRWDAVALLAIAVAVLARLQLAVLLVVLVCAVLSEALLTRGVRDLWRRHRALLVFVGALVAVWLGAAASGSASRLLGSYSVTAEHVRVDLGLLRLVAEHLGVLALGLAVVPFIVGVGWLVDRIRPSAAPAERALALVGVATLVLVTLQVASFDQRFGAGLVKDRYLFYAVPPLLVALAAAAQSRVWPRWWTLALPAAAAAVGFLAMPLTRYEKLNVDTPVAILNDGLIGLATSETWARALLVMVAAVALQALLTARAFVPWRPVAATVAALAAVALPLEAAYAFERLFRVDGTNGLPVTLDQGVVFNWVDRALGPGRTVAFARYPVGGEDWWAGQAYWWDVEFWNESAVVPFPDISPARGVSHWRDLFDPRTGRVLDPPEAQYALLYGRDVRFRYAGSQLLFDRDAYLYEPERPWRASWVMDGIYGDGWTIPGEDVVITVFAEPSQTTALRRGLTLAGSSPDPEPRPVTVRSNLERWSGAIEPQTSFDRVVFVCVPPGGLGRVTIRAEGSTPIYRDPTKGDLSGPDDRPVGIHFRGVALAGETEPMDRCPA
jgi:hypothetical protein